MLKSREYNYEDKCLNIEYNDSKLNVFTSRKGLSTHTFTVYLVAGPWPTDGELISLCDGQDGVLRCDFGGTVSKTGNSAVVQVYVD